METVRIARNNIEIGGGKLVLIAGPCQAESRELCLETAEFLKGLCAELEIGYVFKASYDKANRSSGNSRRGPGLKLGLEYLAAVRDKFDIPVTTDVHEAADAAAAAEVVDMIQIPAFLCRQTDLLLAAGRTGRPAASEAFRQTLSISVPSRASTHVMQIMTTVGGSSIASTTSFTASGILFRCLPVTISVSSISR